MADPLLACSKPACGNEQSGQTDCFLVSDNVNEGCYILKQPISFFIVSWDDDSFWQPIVQKQYCVTSLTETDRNIGIVSKRPIPRPLVSVSVSIEAVFESRYQSRYRSRGMCIFCMVLAEFLLSKVLVSISFPTHFSVISIKFSLD